MTVTTNNGNEYTQDSETGINFRKDEYTHKVDGISTEILKYAYLYKSNGVGFEWTSNGTVLTAYGTESTIAEIVRDMSDDYNLELTARLIIWN